MRTYLIKFLLFLISLPSLAFASENEEVISSLLMPQSGVQYHQKNNRGSHQFLLSSPKRINNEIIIERDIRESGTLHQLMTSLPQASKLESGYDFYLKLFQEQGELLYTCKQRSCGVSSYWANDILGDRQLSGRDSDQYYMAGLLQQAGNTYIMSVYLVANALRQNLAYIQVIQKGESPNKWKNGLLLKPDSQLSPASLKSLKEQLTMNPDLTLYIASYTNKEKFQSVSSMYDISELNFIKVKKILTTALNIKTERVKHKHVGSFHDQQVEKDVESWLRLFLFQS